MAKRESGTVSTRGIGVPKFNQEMLAATIAALAGITLVWTFSQPAPCSRFPSSWSSGS